MLKEVLFISYLLPSAIIAFPTIPYNSVFLQKCTQSCTSQVKDAPICGSDEIMYDSMCTFNCAKRINKDLIPVYSNPNKCQKMGGETDVFKNKVIVKRNVPEENEKLAQVIEFILHNSEGRKALPVEDQAIPNRFEYAVENYDNPGQLFSTIPLKSNDNIPENIWSSLYALRKANRQLMMARNARRLVITELDNIAMNLKNENSKNVVDIESQTNEIQTSSYDELINRMYGYQNGNSGFDETGESAKNTRDMSRKAKALFNENSTDESKQFDEIYWRMTDENRQPKEDIYGKDVNQTVESTPTTASDSIDRVVGQYLSSDRDFNAFREIYEPNESDSEKSSEIIHSTETTLKESIAESEDSLSTTATGDLDENLNESRSSTEAEENVFPAETATEILNGDESTTNQEQDNTDAPNSSEENIRSEPNMAEDTNSHEEHDTTDDKNSNESDISENASNKSINTDTTHAREEKETAGVENNNASGTSDIASAYEPVNTESTKEDQESAYVENNNESGTSDIATAYEPVNKDSTKENQETADVENNDESGTSDIAVVYEVEPFNIDSSKEDQYTTVVENNKESENSDIKISNEYSGSSDSTKADYDTIVLEHNKESDITTSNTTVSTEYSSKKYQDALNNERIDPMETEASSNTEEQSSVEKLFFRNSPINSIEISSPVPGENDSESDLFHFRYATPIDSIFVGDDSVNTEDHEEYVDPDREEYVY